MNPEDQNPTTNPAAPAGPAPDPTAGTTPTAPATPTTPAASDAPADAALSPADSLAAAQESLTAAANAAAAGPDPIAAADAVAASATTPDPVTTPDPAPTTPADPTTPDTSDTSVTDADTAAIIDEPLVPAAPVPGSIGSVTSVPPVADPAATADAPADNAFAAAAAAVRGRITVVEYPVLSGIVGYDLRVMPRAYDIAAVFEQHDVVVVEHLSAILVDIWPEKRFTASDYRFVCAVKAVTAGAYRCEEIVVSVALVYIRSLVCRACDLYEVGRVGQRQAVFR